MFVGLDPHSDDLNLGQCQLRALRSEVIYFSFVVLKSRGVISVTWPMFIHQSTALKQIILPLPHLRRCISFPQLIVLFHSSF